MKVSVLRLLNRLVRLGLGRVELHRLLVSTSAGEKKKGESFEGEGVSEEVCEEEYIYIYCLVFE